MAGFDKWLFLKVLEFIFVVSCVVAKRVTDDEETRLFLYLQKLSREWSLLNSVTWDRLGSAAADATYGGYVVITFGMIIGRALKELPTKRRAMEKFFLGIGAVLFIVLGGLELASLDSIPPDLLDNASVLGTLSILTGILFIIDLAAPRLKESTKQSQTSAHLNLRPIEIPPNNGNIHGLHHQNGIHQNGTRHETLINGHQRVNNGSSKIPPRKTENNNNNQQQFKKQPKSKRFDIFGHDKEGEDVTEFPIEMERHSPVFGKIQRAHYGHFDNVSPTYLRFQNDIEAPPSTPGDPGYVQYTAKRWGQQSQKTPRSSPTEV